VNESTEPASDELVYRSDVLARREPRRAVIGCGAFLNVGSTHGFPRAPLTQPAARGGGSGPFLLRCRRSGRVAARSCRGARSAPISGSEHSRRGGSHTRQIADL